MGALHSGEPWLQGDPVCGLVEQLTGRRAAGCSSPAVCTTPSTGRSSRPRSRRCSRCRWASSRRSTWSSTVADDFARVTTYMVDILAGVPSIVAALFIFALWIATLGFPQSAFAVSLALVLLMLPVVVRNTEEMLKLVPDELREASYALGIPKWKTIAASRCSHRAARHHQRHLAGAGQSDGRDGAGAGAGRLRAGRSTWTSSRATWRRCRC